VTSDDDSEEREVPVTRDIHDQLTSYLTDAHSIEEQALAQLRKAPDVAGDPQIADAFEQHLTETDSHERVIRGLLEARDAKPSRLKDTLMRLGGKGFLLFARVQPDTPGKLVAHALSYEALELASYKLLADVAGRAGEAEVVEAAHRIRDQEQRMMHRLEGLFDRSVDASLRDVGPDELDEQLRKYLADAHAIEEQAIRMLERAPDIVGDSGLGHLFLEHLDETRDHEELIAERLIALGSDPSILKDAAMRLGGLNWGAFFRGHPDTPGKLTAFAYAFEYLEIGGYEQLRRVAQRAGDEQTVRTVETILEEERAAATTLAGAFDRAAEASLQAVGVT
jgi:ferritin-like metal-binding protein YciE